MAMQDASIVSKTVRARRVGNIVHSVPTPRPLNLRPEFLVPPFHNISHFNIFYIQININKFRHIYLFIFININMNVKNIRMMKRRKYTVQYRLGRAPQGATLLHRISPPKSSKSRWNKVTDH